MSDQPETTEGSEGGEQYDAPNQQAVGQEPPWVEGTGGSGEAPVGDTEPAQGGEKPSLDQMTKGELLDHARSLGVTPANNDMTKEELRAGIDAKNAEQQQG